LRAVAAQQREERGVAQVRIVLRAGGEARERGRGFLCGELAESLRGEELHARVFVAEQPQHEIGLICEPRLADALRHLRAHFEIDHPEYAALARLLPACHPVEDVKSAALRESDIAGKQAPERLPGHVLWRVVEQDVLRIIDGVARAFWL